MPAPRPPCFSKGGYDAAHGLTFMNFSDGSIYAYVGLSLAEYQFWAETVPRGTYFNAVYRWSSIPFHKQPAWPDNLIAEFEDP